MNYIKSPAYLDTIKEYMSQNLIKVLIGQRRIGKSVMLSQIMDLIKLEKPGSNLVFIDKEDLSFDEIRNHNDLVSFVEDNKVNIQVAFTIPDEQVKIREFGNLLQIKDNYRKLVVSLDNILISSYQGVEHIHLRDFLTATLLWEILLTEYLSPI